MSSVPNVKWTAYANVALLLCLYFILTIELRRSHYKVCIKMMPQCFYTVLRKMLKCSAVITFGCEFSNRAHVGAADVALLSVLHVCFIV